MISDNVTKGVDRAPHRSLFKAMGYTDSELARPLVAVVHAASEIVPGHIHLDKIAKAVSEGIRSAGGTPVMMPTIGVCDGIAMGHSGMKILACIKRACCGYDRNDGIGACVRRGGVRTQLR